MSVQVKGVRKISTTLSNYHSGMRGTAQKELMTFGFQLQALAMLRSPVDTGRFRANWQLTAHQAPGIFAGIMLSNNLPYAGVLERGSKVGGKPWPSAGPKTTAIGGRVYSKQAPGGVLTPILPAQAHKAAQAVLNGLSK